MHMRPKALSVLRVCSVCLRVRDRECKHIYTLALPGARFCICMSSHLSFLYACVPVRRARHALRTSWRSTGSMAFAPSRAFAFRSGLQVRVRMRIERETEGASDSEMDSDRV